MLLNHHLCSYRGEADVVSTHLSGLQAPCRWSEYNQPRTLQCYRAIVNSDLPNPFFIPSGPKMILFSVLWKLEMPLLPLGTKSRSHFLMQWSYNLDQSFCQIFLCQQLSLSLHPIPKALPSGTEYLAVYIGRDPVTGCWHAAVERLAVHVERHGMLGLIRTEGTLFRAEVGPAKELEPVWP